jgi:hypothetical protein
MMFTQLFGNYLLNKKLVTPQELKDVLNFQKTVHIKLGVMAVNSGFMSADNVNAVHGMQSKVDKKFGELAIEMGFLDEEKLETLLSTQKSGHLLLGQAMLDKKYMSLEQFEEALNNYKKDYRLTGDQFNLLQNGDVEETINAFYNFENLAEGELYKNYLSLLVRNIIRFIDDDFRLLDISPITSYKYEWIASQEIKGEANLYTCIEAEEKAFISFASKYVKEDYTENDEYTKSAVGEFLNLVNGLFLVNMSNNNIELELTPQIVDSEKSLNLLSPALCIPIEFSFGRINFIISGPSPMVV